jgi:hypothetical protein
VNTLHNNNNLALFARVNPNGRNSETQCLRIDELRAVM